MTDLQWLVAAIQPWAVSPHPNFSEKKDVDAFRLLALVAEFRLDLDGEALGTVEDRKQAKVVQAVQDSLLASTQEASIDRLLVLAHDRQLDVAPRAVCALFASVAAAELDRRTEVIPVLERLLFEVSGGDLEARLVEAALLLQLALRHYELGDLAQVHRLAQRALKALRRERFTGAFEVSPGISWGPARVVEDLRLFLRGRALVALATSERGSGRAWIKAVRSRPTWSDFRRELAEARRDQHAVGEAFAGRIDAHSTSVSFGGRDAALQNGYAALLHAQVSGDVSGAFRLAVDLGKALSLRLDANEQTQAKEIIRLFRQGRAQAPLKAFLGWVRSGGPLDALQGSVRDVMASRDKQEAGLNEFDLLVLSAGADLLSDEERRECLARIVRELRAAESIAVRERLWELVVVLRDGTAHHGPELVDFFRQAFESPQATTWNQRRFMAQVARDFDWTSIPASDREHVAALAATADRDDLVDAVLGSQPEATTIAPQGEQEVIWVVDHPHAATDAQVERARAYIEGQLESLRAQHARGVISGGQYDWLAVGVLLQKERPDEAFGETIAETIADLHLRAAARASALRLLSSERVELSDKAKHRLSESRDVWSKPDPDRFPRRTDFSGVFPEALEYSMMLGLAAEGEIVDAVARMVASGDAAAVRQAVELLARTFDRLGAADWVTVTLLQLSHHQDPTVVAYAARALVAVSTRAGVFEEVADRRALELLSADGIRVPLYTVFGFRDRVDADGANSLSEREIRTLERLVRQHPSRAFREAARALLKLVGRAQTQ